jgi:hypothetical protein
VKDEWEVSVAGTGCQFSVSGPKILKNPIICRLIEIQVLVTGNREPAVWIIKCRTGVKHSRFFLGKRTIN